MDYPDLVQARLDEWDREVIKITRANEVRRVTGHNGWYGPIASVDRLILRVSKGAAERQARRVAGPNSPEPTA